jgi:FkbM family methyltransferase
MFFSPSELSSFWKIHPKGIVHVGAHKAEESDLYLEQEWGDIIWIEAQENLATELRRRLHPPIHSVISAAIWDQAGIELNLHIASNSQSSSLLNFGCDSKENPDIKMISETPVVTQRLDEILENVHNADFINLDIQGVELRALIGLGEKISEFNFIYLEVNSKYIYENCSLITEIDEYLFQKNYKRVGVRWRLFRHWGDAIYVKNSMHYSNFEQISQQISNLVFYAKQILSRLKQNFFRSKLSI